MRDYKEFYREAKGDKPRIYCDMDGVLCDFIVQAKKATGVIFTQDKSDSHWKVIKEYPKFWSNMPWMPGGKQLWGFIKSHNPSILSAAVKNNQDPNCKPGKLRWISGNLGLNNSARINLVNRSQKQDYTMIGHSGKREQAVLIDDYPKNITEWTAKGGIGILHTSASSTIRQLKKIGY